MTEFPHWWRQPREVAVVVDNDGWMKAHGLELVPRAADGGDDAGLYRHPRAVPRPAIVFYLGCREVVPAETLARHHRNLVVHASDLPRGRGWSPLTWSVLAGENRIPLCLFEAVEEVDAGPVIYRDHIDFAGHELVDELRAGLGVATVSLCQRFLAEPVPPAGEPQAGEGSWLPRRAPGDSALDPQRSIAEQFELLRVVDNDAYPAFFELRGHRYRLRIDKLGPAGADRDEC